MNQFDKDEFVQLVKDLLPHLHDFSVLQTHPLADTGPFTDGDLSSRGENLQRMVFDTIEMLQPKGIKQAPAVIEWRPYLILHKRYMEGLNLQELSVAMSLSERQIRRDHNRAVLALAGRLWDQLFPPKATEFQRRYKASLEAPQETGREVHYEVLPEVLDLNYLLRGAANIMRLRLEEEDVELELVLPESPPQAVSDRIILRQILFSLFKYALHLLDGKCLRIVLDRDGQIRYKFQVERGWKYWQQEEHEDLLSSTRQWVERINAKIYELYPPPDKAGDAELRLALLLPNRTPILVVDDQEPTLRMFQRYLNGSGYDVVGLTDPAQVLPLARKLQPALITLDVMMPRLDGWEILQALQLDEKTRGIPVIICSAWEEPELARSLGAAAFLKKPIVRLTLLNELEKLGIAKRDDS
jgi:CheY-like chemotaxis protein